MSNPRKNRNVEAAVTAAASAAPASKPADGGYPLFRSTRGKPVMLASISGGHAVSVTHEPEGTPLHPRFHRQAIMEGCLPAASFTEVQAEDAQLVASAGADRRALLRNCISEMTAIATDDPVREREFFDGDGRPNARVMADRLGFPVSIAERDAAWKEYAGDEIEDEGEE